MIAMKRSKVLRTIAIGATWFSLPLVASAQHQQVRLKHGIYINVNYPCKGAPSAAISVWDGVGFHGEHTSECVSHAVHAKGNQFQVTTRCSALGDGTPNPDKMDFKDSFVLTRLSNTRFKMLKSTDDQQIFRWCSLKKVD